MANYKQLMGESTTAYTQDIDNNTNKERTAFEVNTLMQQATKLTSSMLNLAYLQEGFSYREHCRRLTIPNNPDFVAKRFMASCEDIPDKWMDSSRWQVEPVRVLGNGSIQLAQQQSSAIMAVYDKLNPEAQVVALNQYVFVATGQNAGLTNALAPLDKAPHITDTVHDTQLVFAGLMSGIPIDPKAGLVPVEVCQEMLKQMGKVVQMIQQSGGMGTPQQVHGLKMAAMYTQVHIAKIAQDKAQKSVAKQLGDQLGQIMNLVKAFEQRQQEAAKAAAKNTGQQADPKAMAKLQADAMASRQKLGEKDAAAKQALVHKHVAFIADQQRKNLESVASVHRQHMEAAAKPKPNALED
jgi:gas vesicle protein